MSNFRLVVSSFDSERNLYDKDFDTLEQLYKDFGSVDELFYQNKSKLTTLWYGNDQYIDGYDAVKSFIIATLLNNVQKNPVLNIDVINYNLYAVKSSLPSDSPLHANIKFIEEELKKCK